MADTQTALSDAWDDDDLPEDTDDLEDDPELIAQLERSLGDAAAGRLGMTAAEAIVEMREQVTRWVARQS